MRLQGRKKELKDDHLYDLAGGSAWVILLVGGCFISILFITLIGPYLFPFIKNLDEPLQIVLLMVFGAVCIYIPYKIACFIVPQPQEYSDHNPTSLLSVAFAQIY